MVYNQVRQHLHDGSVHIRHLKGVANIYSNLLHLSCLHKSDVKVTQIADIPLPSSSVPTLDKLEKRRLSTCKSGRV